MREATTTCCGSRHLADGTADIKYDFPALQTTLSPEHSDPDTPSPWSSLVTLDGSQELIVALLERMPDLAADALLDAFHHAEREKTGNYKSLNRFADASLSFAAKPKPMKLATAPQSDMKVASARPHAPRTVSSSSQREPQLGTPFAAK